MHESLSKYRNREILLRTFACEESGQNVCYAIYWAYIWQRLKYESPKNSKLFRPIKIIIINRPVNHNRLWLHVYNKVWPHVWTSQELFVIKCSKHFLDDSSLVWNTKMAPQKSLFFKICSCTLNSDWVKFKPIRIQEIASI